MTRQILMAFVASTYLIACGGEVPGEVDESDARGASSVVSKKLGEECTFDVQCEGSQDRADLLWGMGVGPRVLDADVVCRPTSQLPGSPDLQCQPIGDVGDACLRDADCLSGLRCEDGEKAFSSDSTAAGSCALVGDGSDD